MTKQQAPSAPQPSDVEKYLKTKTDLALELEVYRIARELHYESTHGGTYVDPVSQKVRQYDVRASMLRPPYRIRLAIECKALSPMAPLVVACTRRACDDAVIDFVHSFNPGQSDAPPKSAAHGYSREPSRPELYREKEYVGKTIAQIEFDPKTSEWISKGDLFDKWSQALGSAADQVEQAKRASTRHHPDIYTAIIPMLVVPDDTLWVANFNTDGLAEGDPQIAASISLQIHRVFDSDPDTGFMASHLHIVTRSAFANVLDCLAAPSNERFLNRHILFGRLNYERQRERERRDQRGESWAAPNTS